VFLLAGYKGMAVYPRELKVKACKMYFEEGKKATEICKTLGIKNRAQPQFWFKQYREDGGYDAVGIKEKGKPNRNRVDETAYRIKQLTMENEILRDFLQMLERV
jgi:transposase-like protein